jgi:phosphohistidine phosphatase SixA
MLITCITHAAARGKEHPFRGLTEQGWQEVDRAAERFKSRAGLEIPKIEAVVTSPKARCVETAILFAKAISEFAATSEIKLETGLKAGSVSGNELFDITTKYPFQHLLVSAHADLVRTLPDHVKLIDEAADGGWFAPRPVLFQLEYHVGESWNNARLIYCEGLIAGEWRNLTG